MVVANYRLLGVSDVTQRVHGGSSIQDLLCVLQDRFLEQFVVLSSQGDFYVESPIRSGEPQVDVYGSIESAERVVLTLEKMAMHERGYSAHKLTQEFLSDYEQINEKAEKETGSVRR